MAKADILNAMHAVETDHPTIIDAPLVLSPELPKPTRPNHANEVWARPDGVAVLEYEDTQLAILTKAIPAARPPFVLTVIAVRMNNDGPWTASDALRHHTDGDLAGAASQPVETFAELLDQYAVDFT